MSTVEIKETVKKLQHEYDTNRGLWCINKNPKDVSIDWIRENAFQLTNQKTFILDSCNLNAACNRAKRFN